MSFADFDAIAMLSDEQKASVLDFLSALALSMFARCSTGSLITIKSHEMRAKWKAYLYDDDQYNEWKDYQKIEHERREQLEKLIHTHIYTYTCTHTHKHTQTHTHTH